MRIAIPLQHIFHKCLIEAAIHTPTANYTIKAIRCDTHFARNNQRFDIFDLARAAAANDALPEALRAQLPPVPVNGHGSFICGVPLPPEP